MLYYIKRGILPESFIVVCDSWGWQYETNEWNRRILFLWKYKKF
jgi:hypothetical protein